MLTSPGKSRPHAKCTKKPVSKPTATGHTLTDWALENVYDIYPAWRHRYAPGVVFNTERVFGLALPARVPVVLSPREHVDCVWLPWRAAAERCSSASNAEAILHLPAWVQG
jgi:dATP pyrophosphohydrolase